MQTKHHNEKEGEIVTGGTIIWEAPEYEYKPKNASWYWASLIIATALIIISLLGKNFLFAIFVVIAELVIIYFSSRFPKVWEFRLTNRGLKIGDFKFYPFEEIEEFDIHPFDHEYKELILRVKSKMTPYIKIFIFHDDEIRIKERLEKFSKKQEIPQSLADILERFFRF